MTRPEPSGTTSYLSQQQVPLPGARSAALRGATSAFLKPRTEFQPELSNGTRHGAAAAAAAGRGQQSVTTLPVSKASAMQIELRPPQEIGSDRNSHAASFASSDYPSPDYSNSSHNRSLSISSSTATALARSPSNIAATLAAARQLPRSQSKNIIPPDGAVSEAKARLGVLEGAPKESAPRARGQMVKQSKSSIDVNEKTDSTSIAPTTTLVQLFEHASSGTQADQTDKAVIQSRGPAPPIESPKPRRAVHSSNASTAGGKLSSSRQDLNVVGHGSESMATGTSIIAKPVKLASSTRSAPILALNGSEQEPTIAVVDEPPNHALKDDMPQPSSKLAPQKSVSRPELPPPRKSKPKLDDGTSETRSLHPPPASTPKNARAKSPLTNVPRHPPDTLKPLPKPTTGEDLEVRSLSQRRVTPHMTGDSLANAIVGATLASSRGPTPALSPAPRPPLPKRHTSSHHPFHLHHQKSRTPSPSKGFTRTTMRTTSSDEDEIISRGAKPKGLFARKHPNKHHEGSRKRWRDEITERERKRYEGLWAANRGLYVPFSAIEMAYLAPHNSAPAEAGRDLVSNLVVRDIWSRSRLPDHMLEEVWDLVDNEGKGRLAREEFVVGLWLIDQRLKGRKLPFKVGESVWASVRTVKGVSVPRKFK